MNNILSQGFSQFAESECKGSSTLYEQLSLAIAGDEAMLELAGQVPPGQPKPNLLFGVIHYLLLQGRSAELAAFYASLSDAPRSPDQAFPYFRDFCLRQWDEIISLLASRRVQTNEVRRCAYLFPAFGLVYRLTRQQPLSLVEIGTSAGLNLLWDYYRYDYGDEAMYGRVGSPVEITTTFRGAGRPDLSDVLPVVQERVGLDLNVLDVRRDEDVLWLQALVWPEQDERAARLREAIGIARSHPPKLIEGDGIALLPEVLTGLADETTLCIFHTYTLNQVAPEARERLADYLRSASLQRDIYRVSCEWLNTAQPQLELTIYRQGSQDQTLLAYCDFHGRWVEWLTGDV